MHQHYTCFAVKRILPVLLWLLPALSGKSQLGVGSSGSLFVESGTTFNTDGLVLIPSTALTLSSNSIVKTATPVGSSVPGMGSIERVYDIGAPFTYSGSLGIMYEDAELGLNIESMLQIAYRETPTGPWITTSGSTVNTGTNYVTFTASGIDLSSVTTTTANFILPITYSNLSARLDGQFVLINWKAASNTTLEGFNIQSSIDGRTWTNVGHIPAVQNRTEYSFKDRDLNFATRYYRIGMIEATGEITYTNIANVRKPLTPFSLQALLNSGGRVINFINGTPDGIELFDLHGRLLKQSNVAQTSYNIGTIPTGIYILRFKVGTELHVRKLFLE